MENDEYAHGEATRRERQQQRQPVRDGQAVIHQNPHQDVGDKAIRDLPQTAAYV